MGMIAYAKKKHEVMSNKMEERHNNQIRRRINKVADIEARAVKANIELGVMKREDAAYKRIDALAAQKQARKPKPKTSSGSGSSNFWGDGGMMGSMGSTPKKKGKKERGMFDFD